MKKSKTDINFCASKFDTPKTIKGQHHFHIENICCKCGFDAKTSKFVSTKELSYLQNKYW